MRVKERLLDWWGRSDHRRRMNVVEAALRKAGDRGRTRDELIEGTEFSLNQVRTALRKLRAKGRAEADGDWWRVSGT
jgi:predicted Rossmann fold nucleotide-binding protein DprA/Smf involved in DNA uptake